MKECRQTVAFLIKLSWREAHYNAGVRILRELTRYRYKLTSMKSSEKNRFQNAFTVCNVGLDSVLASSVTISTTSWSWLSGWTPASHDWEIRWGYFASLRHSWYWPQRRNHGYRWNRCGYVAIRPSKCLCCWLVSPRATLVSCRLPRKFLAFRGWFFLPFSGALLIRESFTLNLFPLSLTGC